MGMALESMMAPTADSRAGDVLRLRREISRLQRRRSDLPLLPVAPVLQPILPEGGLQVGTTYSLSSSPGLIATLLAGASATGAWCAAVGMPTLGVEALAGHGVDLDRMLFVPEPGARWLSAVSALSEVVPLIAIRPSGPARSAELSRLGARLRDRGCTLLVVAGNAAARIEDWPQSEGSIRVHDARWHGLGSGWGALEECEVTVTARTRRSPVPQSVRVRLPGRRGVLEAIETTTAPRLVPLPSLRPPGSSEAGRAQASAAAAPPTLAAAG
ncbi:hypothetical protein [uncultured Microbacterium sp.]|uniref:hypothetical protein n=1 Tax=uncultured Microbacterium sp. TaxID=191216 RepID=UPI0025E13579|nr:hypothetical protein [uncultured Microbacterium sp.]